MNDVEFENLMSTDFYTLQGIIGLLSFEQLNLLLQRSTLELNALTPEYYFALLKYFLATLTFLFLVTLGTISPLKLLGDALGYNSIILYLVSVGWILFFLWLIVKNPVINKTLVQYEEKKDELKRAKNELRSLIKNLQLEINKGTHK
ncbi:MAG: hypothetical protein WAU11_10555 [Ignavibacteriaceae bacterium]